MLVMCIHTYTD